MNDDANCLSKEDMIRSQWTRQIGDTYSDGPNGFPNGVACMRKVSEYVTECVRIIGERKTQVVVTHEPSSILQHTYQTQFEVKQVLWCTFPRPSTECSPLECICLVGEKQIDIYATADQHYYSCVVPFKLHGVYSSSHGLIMERTQDHDIGCELEENLCMPNVYSLSHPYHELFPVLYSWKEDDENGIMQYCWENEKQFYMVGSSHDLFLVYDGRCKQHRLYALRTTSAVDDEDANENDLLPKLATPTMNFNRSLVLGCIRQQHHTPLNAAPASAAIRSARTVRSQMTSARMNKNIPFTFNSPITPIANSNGGNGLLGGMMSAKHTPNLSLHSMGESSPFIRFSRLPVTSTPRTSLAPLQFNASFNNETAVRCSVPESFVSEFFFELVWVEKEECEKADKMFASFDLNRVSYVNWMAGDSIHTMRVTLPQHNDRLSASNRFSPLVCTPGNTPLITPCADAQYVDGNLLTAVVSTDRSSIILHSGTTKVGVLVLKMPLTSPCRLHLLAACENAILIETKSGSVLHVRIRPLFQSQFAARLWETLADSLPSQHEKLQKVLSSWALFNRQPHGDITEEACSLARLIMEQTGVSVDELDAEKDDESDDTRMFEEIGEENRVVGGNETTDGVTIAPPSRQGTPRKRGTSDCEKETDEKGDETRGAKHSRSDEVVGMNDDEKWSCVMTVMQSCKGAFPTPVYFEKPPLISLGPSLRPNASSSVHELSFTARPRSPSPPSRSIFAPKTPKVQLSSKHRRVVLCPVHDAALSTVANLAFQSLHLSYEDAKLHSQQGNLLQLLAVYLYAYARWQSLSAYANYYARDFPFLLELKILEKNPTTGELREVACGMDTMGGEEDKPNTTAGRIRGLHSEKRHRGGLLQLRRGGSQQPNVHPPHIHHTPNASMYTPPTRNQTFPQVPSTFNPNVVPSVADYIVSLLQLSDQSATLSVFRTIEREQQEMEEMIGEGRRRRTMTNEPSTSNAVTSNEDSHSTPAIVSVLTPTIMSPTQKKSSFTPAPPSTPHATALILLVGIGLNIVKSTADVSRMLGVSWKMRLKLSEKQQALLIQTINNRELSTGGRCEEVLSILGWTKTTVFSLRPPLAILVTLLLAKRRKSERTRTNFNAELGTHIDVFKFPTLADMSACVLERWPYDKRVQNAMSMLDSSRPVFIPPHPDDRSLSEAELRDSRELFLIAVCHRVVCQSFGRALINLMTELPTPNEPFRVSELCMTGRTHPNNYSVDVSNMEAMRPVREWGEYYNGVSTGLKFVSSQMAQSDSEWLAMCTTHSDRPGASAGVIYALGLTGHIKAMNMFHVHEILTLQEKMTSMSILLGFSAANLGSGDIQVYKILTTHLPFLMGPTLLELHVESILQTAAINGLGLLFAQSGNVKIINQLVNEMGKAPSVEIEPASDRYSYGLSCGFAIGLIGLGDGNSLAVSEVPVEQALRSTLDRLIVLMNGGSRADCVYSSSGAGVVDWQSVVSGSTPTHNAPGVPIHPQTSTHVKEGADNVNVHITGHGATVALGLVFMKTANKDVASALALPNTLYEIEGIRPDVLSVRVICSSIVNWEEIDKTHEWIEGNVPECIRKYETILIRLSDESFTISREQKHYWEKIVDRETVAQTWCYSVSGACFALALKNPSTCCPMIKKLLLYYVRVFMPVRQQKTGGFAKPEGHSRLCRLAGQSCISDCINMLICALAIVFAGSGDLDVLRICRAWRIGGEDPHRWAKTSVAINAQQMAVHLSLGLLFAGRGRMGIKGDSLSVALLFISFYPLYGNSVADNKQYLGPLRFLLTLCLEQRLVNAIDSISGKMADAAITIKWKSGDSEVARTPYVLPPLELLESVVIGRKIYESIKFDLSMDSCVQELRKVMRQQHGRILLNYNNTSAGDHFNCYVETDGKLNEAGEEKRADPTDMYSQMAYLKTWKRDLDKNWTEDDYRIDIEDELIATMEKCCTVEEEESEEGRMEHLPKENDRMRVWMKAATCEWLATKRVTQLKEHMEAIKQRVWSSDLHSCALPLHDIQLLCRVLEGQEDCQVIDQRLVGLLEELVERKIAEDPMENLPHNEYRIRSRETLDSNIFSIS